MSLAFLLALVVVGVAAWVFGRARTSGMPVAGAGTGRASKAKPKCAWSLTGEHKGKFIEYRCSACDVVAYSSTGAAPEICKRNLKGTS